MEPEKKIVISKNILFEDRVDLALDHLKALRAQTTPGEETTIPPIKRVLLSSLFYMPAFGLLGALAAWFLIEPWFSDAVFLDNLDSESFESTIYLFIMSTLTMLGDAIIVFFICIGEGMTRGMLSLVLGHAIRRAAWTFLFSLILSIPESLIVSLVGLFLPENIPSNINDWSAALYISNAVLRSILWTGTGITIGLGLYLGQGTRTQVISAVLGGAVGGAVGGIAFDAIDRFLLGGVDEASASRLITFLLTAFGVCLFVAIGQQLSREGWFWVRTGPIRGKSFSLYRDMMVIGSSPKADIYLFKDPKVEPRHAVVHKIGAQYEIDSVGQTKGFLVNGEATTRRRLISGDQVALGSTILEFQERAKKRPTLRINKNKGRQMI